MLRGSTHYCAIEPRALLRHIVDCLGSRRMETAPTSTEVLLRPTLVSQTSHLFHVVLLSGGHPSNLGPGPALRNFSDRAYTDELSPYSV